jgi:cell division protein FtsI (penicillin-binding protein 3)
VRAIDRRIGLVFSAFVLLLVVVVARATWVQAVQGGPLSADAQSQQVETVIIPGHRGSILDRKRKPLAVSEDAASVFATPYQVEDAGAAARKLGRLLDLPSEHLLDSLADRSSGFAYLARKVDLDVAAKISRLDLDGIGLLPDSRRVYPQGRLAAQVIGTVGIDNEGLTGLEAANDDILRGEDGEREVVRDALGEELQRNTLEGAELGEHLRLTIDASLQGHTDEVLREIGRTYEPDGATAIVLDPRTSEVLAMANWPGIDPDSPATADPDHLGNMATGYTFEPGSTFKAFTVAAALEAGLVGPDTVFHLPPTITLYDRTIGESHERGHISLTVAEILSQSSNVGAVKIGLELGAERFDHWIRRFGFGEPTGIDFPGEERGIVIPTEDYSGSTMGNLPIGQGLSVTAIQMATAYAAIANGGILRAPHFVLERDDAAVGEPVGERTISRATARAVSEMLEGVLGPGGTAEETSVPGYTLAGKTGTAQKVVDGTYSESEYVASFVGYAPAQNPRVLVSVVVDNPKGDYYGGTVAAPAFGEIAKFALPYLGVPPDSG